MRLTIEHIEQFHIEHPEIAGFAQYFTSRNFPLSDKRHILFNRLFRTWLREWVKRYEMIAETKRLNSWSYAADLGKQDFPQNSNPFDFVTERNLHNGYEYGYRLNETGSS